MAPIIIGEKPFLNLNQENEEANETPNPGPPSEPAAGTTTHVEPNEKTDHVINESPIEQVRDTIPTTDDPTLPALTFRTWILGPAINVLMVAAFQICSYRKVGILVSQSLTQILIQLVGKLMAAKIPKKTVKIPGTKFEFSTNPGPFNIKEHVLLSILATTGFESSQSIPIINVIKSFFHKEISFTASFLLVQTNQMIGYGLAGMFTKFLVESPYMWFPTVLLDVSFYRALNETEKRPKGGLSKLQFLTMVGVSSFAYCIVSNFFMTPLAAISFVCWIWKDSVKAQIIGSGTEGLGIGSFSLDWLSISGYAGSPFSFPRFAIINKLVGCIIIIYILSPIAYWMDLYHAKRFPFMSLTLFDHNGSKFNTDGLFDNKLVLDREAYHNYSKVYMSIFTALATGLGFAGVTATITHFILFHGRDAWLSIRRAIKSKETIEDIHNELMKKYKPIPQWWFITILVLSLGFAIFNCQVYGDQIQLPTWALLAAIFVPALLILPFGAIVATTGMAISTTLIGEMIMGYTSPGKPIGNLAFVAYTLSTKRHALNFIAEFKLGHYMKIPPRSMFLVQIVGALLASTTRIVAAWWALTSIKNICVPDPGNIWTCPADTYIFNDALIWGGIGPSEVFAPYGDYKWLYIFFLIGVIGPFIVWFFSRIYPEKKWIRLIVVPLIVAGPGYMPPMGTAHLWSFFILAFIVNFLVYSKNRGWWAKYAYNLSNGLDLGASLYSVFSMALILQGIYGVQWKGIGYQCPLASCPTAPGLVKDGCPVFN